MKNSKINNLMPWIGGTIFAVVWRYLLKDMVLPEVFKWIGGIIVIILFYIITSKTRGLKNNIDK